MKKVLTAVIIPLSAALLGLLTGIFLECLQSEPAIVSEKLVRSYQRDLYYNTFSRSLSADRSAEALRRRADEVKKLADIAEPPADIADKLDYDGLYLTVFSPDSIFGYETDKLWCRYSFIGSNGEYSVWKGRKGVCEFDVFPQVREVNCLYYNKSYQLVAACKNDVYIVTRRDGGSVYGFVKLMQPFKAAAGRLKAFFSKVPGSDKPLYSVTLKLYGFYESDLSFDNGVDATDYADYQSPVIKARPISAAIEAADMKDRLLYESADGDFTGFKASLRTDGAVVSVSACELRP